VYMHCPVKACLLGMLDCVDGAARQRGCYIAHQTIRRPLPVARHCVTLPYDGCVALASMDSPSDDAFHTHNPPGFTHACCLPTAHPSSVSTVRRTPSPAVTSCATLRRRSTHMSATGPR
jgi:hypothetical protein